MGLAERPDEFHRKFSPHPDHPDVAPFGEVLYPGHVFWGHHRNIHAIDRLVVPKHLDVPLGTRVITKMASPRWTGVWRTAVLVNWQVNKGSVRGHQSWPFGRPEISRMLWTPGNTLVPEVFHEAYNWASVRVNPITEEWEKEILGVITEEWEKEILGVIETPSQFDTLDVISDLLLEQGLMKAPKAPSGDSERSDVRATALGVLRHQTLEWCRTYVGLSPR